jgi:TolA-binding protein
MKRFWPLLALLLIAATGDESRLFRVAQATFDDKLYDVAERQFSEFLQTYPQSEFNDRAQSLLGRAQLNQGKWQESVKTFSDGLAVWPAKRPDGFRFWLAEALAKGEKYAEAEARYREVLDQFPRSSHRAAAWYGLAFVELKLNRLPDAMAALDQLAKLSPGSDLAVAGDLLRGQVELAGGKLDAAAAVFARVARQAPGTRVFFEAQYWLGRTAAQRKQYPEALAYDATVTGAFAEKPGRPVDGQLAAETWFATGWAQWELKDFAKAAEAFGAAFTNAQTVALRRDALLKLGEASVRAGNLTNGVDRLRQFLAEHPQDALADQVQMAIGDLLVQGDMTDLALPEYVKLIATYPQSGLVAQAQFKAGMCAWNLGQWAEALKFYQQATAAATGKDAALAAKAGFKVADAQFALGQYADAVESYQRVISTHSNQPELDRAMFQLGLAFWRLHNTEGAATALEALLKQFPSVTLAPEAQFVLGQVWAGAGQEADARVAFENVLQKFPKTTWAKKASLAIGESFQREGKLDAAIAQYNKLMEPGLDSELAQRAFYRRGWCYAQQGAVTNTLAEFSDFLEKKPRADLAPEIEFWVANHYLAGKDYLKAQAEFQKLVTNYPTNRLADSAQYMAGRTAYARQDYKGAIEIFENLMKTYTNSTFRCDARFAQGDALSELGQFDDALLVFDALLKEFPDCYLVCEAQGRRGDCQYTLNRIDDAIASYRKALDCAKDSASRNQALFKIGQCYEKAGKLDEALASYTKPLYEFAVSPESAEPPERFWSCKAGRAAADIKERQQQWREAITLYEKLAALCPDMKDMALDRVRKIRTEHFILN